MPLEDKSWTWTLHGEEHEASLDKRASSRIQPQLVESEVWSPMCTVNPALQKKASVGLAGSIKGIGPST
jgi:hypothetical protein